MSLAFDLYTSRQSWLHRVDPRVKLLFVASALLLLILFRNVFILIAALLLVHLLHLSIGTRPRQLALVWRALLPVILLVFAAQVLFYPAGAPLLQLGPIRITVLAIAQGVVLASRIITMALVVFAWLYTTDQPSLVRSLVRLGLPYEWGLTLALALRYIPNLHATYELILQAQQARGLDLAESKGLRRVRRMMPIFVAIIITSLRASEQLARALEARALGATGVQRSAWHEIRFRPADYLLTALILLVLFSLIYLRLRAGFGADPVELLHIVILNNNL